MKPTNKFRQLLGADVYIGTTEHGDDVYGQRYKLQQWWKPEGEFDEDGGEWRDVPIETEDRKTK